MGRVRGRGEAEGEGWVLASIAGAAPVSVRVGVGAGVGVRVSCSRNTASSRDSRLSVELPEPPGCLSLPSRPPGIMPTARGLRRIEARKRSSTRVARSEASAASSMLCDAWLGVGFGLGFG